MSMRGAGIGLALVASVIALAPPVATAKLVDYRWVGTPGRADVGDVVRIHVTVVPAPNVRLAPCDLRLVVVAPGVDVARALSAVEGGRRPPGRIGAWEAFRLATWRQVGPLQWTGRLRPGRTGTWRLVIPNVCTGGYLLPRGASVRPLTVTPNA